ncbi:MAG TPA: DUF6519 domain-containing protein [Jiangellales bacterium]|nr:DUF6519 domain-containing protein [Jiangellales bacterium]
MPGDYSRTTFDPEKHFSAVLMQQGRVQLDADWNEQHDITLHILRSLAADLIGPHGGPGDGFAVSPARGDGGAEGPRDFAVGAGHYYVDGILCENDRPAGGTTGDAACTYLGQPDFRPGRRDQLTDGRYLVYLDVWEREVTALEDDGIREVALGGPDTAARNRMVWQVRVLPVATDAVATVDADPLVYLRSRLPFLSSAQLTATTSPPGGTEAGYTGQENRLYRVQVHRSSSHGRPTFVWSRHNASVDLPVTAAREQEVVVEDLVRDIGPWVATGDLVEMVDDDSVLDPRRASRRVRPLRRVHDVVVADRLVRLEGRLPAVDLRRHPRLRRWDHGRLPDEGLDDGAVPVREGEWLELEDGVAVWFTHGGDYLAGDHWQIPARSATADVDWPRASGVPEPRPPRGTRHHHAPLGLIAVAGPAVAVERSYRRRIVPSVVSDQ